MSRKQSTKRKRYSKQKEEPYSSFFSGFSFPLVQRKQSPIQVNIPDDPLDLGNRSTKELLPIIYFLINTHGGVKTASEHDEYVKTHGFDLKKMPTYDYGKRALETVRLPVKQNNRQIDHIQKITFSEFNTCNLMDHLDDEKLLTIGEHLKDYNNTHEKPLIGEELKRFFQENYETVYDKKYLILTNHFYDIRNPFLKKFEKTKPYRYNNFMYSSDTRTAKKKKAVLYNKEYTLNNDKHSNPSMNVHVLYQHGGLPGGFETGDTLLDKSSEDGSYIDTSTLLELACRYGYKTVVIIDYTCDTIEDDLHIDPDEVTRIRNDMSNGYDTIGKRVKKGTIGRGGRKKSIKKKSNKKYRYTIKRERAKRAT